MFQSQPSQQTNMFNSSISTQMAPVAPVVATLPDREIQVSVLEILFSISLCSCYLFMLKVLFGFVLFFCFLLFCIDLFDWCRN